MKDFDLEKWLDSQVEEVESILSSNDQTLVRSWMKAGFNKAKELLASSNCEAQLYDQQLAELKQEIWDAARARVSTGRNSTNCDGEDYDEGEDKYKSLADYEESKKDGQDD